MSPRPRLLLGVALLVQLVVLYAPQGPGEIPFPHADKLVHFVVFLVPTLLALWGRLPVRWVVAALVAHAVLSEVIQGALLADRSGDARDAVADTAGVAVGVLLWLLARRRR